MKLIDLLKEVGEATSRPYDWKMTADHEDYKEYMFQTKTGFYYKVEIEVLEGDEERDSAFVQFGIVEPDEDNMGFTNFDAVPSKGDLFNIMATIVEVLKDLIKKNPSIKYLQFETTKGKNKESNARLNLYIKYIQKHLPNAEVTTDSRRGYEMTSIKLKEVGEATAKPYKWENTFNKEDYKAYVFKTDSGLNYQLNIKLLKGDEELETARIEFGIVDGDYFTDYDETPSRGEVYKVMATVVDILKDFVKKNKGVKYLHFTTNKVGPGETKRLGLYKQYIQKHLPNAEIETKNRYGAEVTTITLKEIGDASAKPYKFEKVYEDDFERTYGFETESGQLYNVIIEEVDPEDPYYYKGSDPISKMKRISVRFYTVAEDPDAEEYDKVVNKGELFKVMATIVDILRLELKLRPSIEAIEFKPSKRKVQDKARLELYKRFFKNFYPNTEFKTYGEEVVAILKK